MLRRFESFILRHLKEKHLKSLIKPVNCLIIPDVHYRAKKGGEDRRTLDAIKAYANDHRWSHVVWIGDVMDHNSISHHNAGKMKSVEGETLFKDYAVANKDLDEFEQATPGAEKWIIEGNHDFRATAYVDFHPQLEGLVEAENGLKIAERTWNWVPYWSTGKVLDLGKASFGHGRYTNKYHAEKHATRYGRNFYYGHLHDVQSFTVERDGDNLKYEAASLGCVCNYDQSYLKGAATKWQQAITTFMFQPNGYFNRYTSSIFNHSFISPFGKTYKG